MQTIPGLVEQAIIRDSSGASFLPALLACFPDAHWRAIDAPGALRLRSDGSVRRHVPAPERFIHWAQRHRDELDTAPAPESDVAIEPAVDLACCVETDTFVLAIEDATSHALEPGTTTYGKRHRVSRVIEAVRALADGRLYAVGIVAACGFDEPRRTTILEGLPHLHREEAEDLYASYWGWCTPEQLRQALSLSN